MQREDGQIVRLFCPDCRREDFSAIQGFISHCRISHNRRFKSFEQASVAAGQPIKLIICGKRKTTATNGEQKEGDAKRGGNTGQVVVIISIL